MEGLNRLAKLEEARYLKHKNEIQRKIKAGIDPKTLREKSIRLEVPLH